MIIQTYIVYYSHGSKTWRLYLYFVSYRQSVHSYSLKSAKKRECQGYTYCTCKYQHTDMWHNLSRNVMSTTPLRMSHSLGEKAWSKENVFHHISICHTGLLHLAFAKTLLLWCVQSLVQKIWILLSEMYQIDVCAQGNTIQTENRLRVMQHMPFH